MNSFSLVCTNLYLYLLISSSYASYCPSWSRTHEVSLTGAPNSSVLDHFTAVNVTFHPTESVVSERFIFIPAVSWINTSCHEANMTVLHSRIPSFTEIKSIDDVLNASTSKTLPDWSLLADRSVLVVNLYPLKWDPRGSPCPRLKLSFILRFPAQTLASSSEQFALFAPELSEFSTSCRDSALFQSVYPVLFSASSHLIVEIDRLESNPRRFDSTVNFVVSAGYRLPPSVFTCPNGLFACPPVTGEHIQELPDALSWDQRICLPFSLRCDGVPNCPGSTFDEEQCDNMTFPTHFPEIPDEHHRLLAHVAAYSADKLSSLTAELALAGTGMHGSLLLYCLLFGIPIACIAAIVAMWLVYKRRRIHPHLKSRKEEKIHNHLATDRCTNGKLEVFDADQLLDSSTPTNDHKSLVESA